MNLKKALIALIASAIVSNCYALVNHINSYNSLVNTLKQGSNAFALFDLTKCQKAPGSTADASMNPRGVNVVDLVINDTVSYAGKPMKTIAVDNHGYFGRNDFIIYRSLYRFLEDNTVEVIDDNIDPVTYKLKDRTWMVCRMTADNSGGVSIIIKK